MMNWHFLPLAIAVAFAAALAFYPARRCGRPIRKLAGLAASVVIALSPCLIPLDAKPLRFGASLIAIALLVKLYDIYKAPAFAEGMSLRSYFVYLNNWYWLVLRREPNPVPVPRDIRCLAVEGLASLFMLLCGVVLWHLDWSAVPFALEHALKVFSVVLTVVLMFGASAAAYRLLGGRALEPMSNPIAAPTPADFWRRWNRPAQQFLQEYAFTPAGGFRRAVRASLATFGVSGLCHEYVFGIADGQIQGVQFLFFSLQGCAVAATMRFRPSWPTSLLWVAVTILFNLATSVLFFRSVDAVLPFYSLRSH
jgi:hypothetical protein